MGAGACPEKPLVFENVRFYETKLTVRRFSRTLDNLLVSVVISYCRSEVIVFRFYQKWNAVRSKNSELSRRISLFLPVPGELIMH